MNETMTLQEVRISNGYLRKQLDICKKQLKETNSKFEKLLAFVKHMADINSGIYPVSFSIDAEKLLREIGELDG